MKNFLSYVKKTQILFRNWEVLNSDELDSHHIQLPFEEVRMNQIKDAADFLGIELEDYIYYRQHDKRGIRSKMKVPVGYVPIKRVQQILSKRITIHLILKTEVLRLVTLKVNQKLQLFRTRDICTYGY